MYQPKKYLKKDREYIYKFIQENPFATFVLKGDRLLATHIPVLIKGPVKNFTLYAHIANHNEQFQFLKEGKEALLIFQGPNGYVSSSWYKEKEISTWDYSAVHVNVKLKLQTEEELEDSLQDLVQKFETQQENPLYFKDLPREIVEENISRITGFWCEPIKVEAIAKLHQGFDRDDLESVTRHLEAKDDPMACPLSRDIKKENNLY